MQNQLERGGSFSAMLVSASDPCFGGPEHHHDFTSLNGSGGDYAALLNNTHQQHHHHQSHQQPLPHHHPEPNNNGPPQSNPTAGSNGTPKPKKVPPPNGKKTKGRVKIKMEFIDNKLRRYTTFSKRKTGIMKKAYELSTLTGTQVMLLVASETGHVYTFATRKLQPMITSEAGKALIQTCLNSPDPPNTGSDTQRMSATGYEETELTYAADPNGSEHGDTKDDYSESVSSDGDEAKDVPPSLLPLTANGLLPPNFAALFASASATGFSASKGGLTIGLVPASQADAGQSSGSHRSTGTPHHNHQHSHHHQQHGPTSTSSASTSSPSKSIRIKREASGQ